MDVWVAKRFSLRQITRSDFDAIHTMSGLFEMGSNYGVWLCFPTSVATIETQEATRGAFGGLAHPKGVPKEGVPHTSRRIIRLFVSVLPKASLW